MKLGFVSLVLFFTATVAANPPQGRLAVAEVWSISFPNGEATRQPTATVIRGALIVPFDDWSWVLELGIATPNTQFAAAPELVTGVTRKLGGPWSAGFMVTYHLNPPYSGHDLTHVFAVSLAPAVKINDSVTFVFVGGVGKVLGEDGPWSVTISPKFSIALPW